MPFVAAVHWFGVVVFLLRLLGGNLFGYAAVFTVDSLNDEERNPGAGANVCQSTPSGVCTLRTAIQTASADDEIQFNVSGVITLDALLGELVLDKNLTVTGPGTESLAVDGNTTTRVLWVNNDVTATVSGLTIRNGEAGYGDGGGLYNGGALTLTNVTVNSSHASYGGRGGGLFNDSGVLTLSNVTISDSTAVYGGGIFNDSGTLILNEGTVSGNSAAVGSGGGVFNSSGALTLTDTTVSKNSAYIGGGVFNENGTVTLTYGIVSDNTSSSDGGGIFNDSGTLILNGMTVSNNSASEVGGGVSSSGTMTLTGVTVSGNNAYSSGGLFNGGTATLTNGTVSDNSAAIGGGLFNNGTLTLTHGTVGNNSAANGSGIFNNDGVVTLASSIVANEDGENCSGIPSINSQGDNIISDATCLATDISLNDRNNLDPWFDPAGLQDNGGPTDTLALQAASPAINSVRYNVCPSTDQREVTRPNDGCDIGAFELVADLHISNTDGVTTATPGAQVTYTIVAGNNGPDAVKGAVVSDSFPAALTGCAWTCVGEGGGACSANGSGSINDTVNLPVDANVTYTATCTVNSAATGTLNNTATITSDVQPANNSATDSDTLEPKADVGITKTGPATINGGGLVTYSVVVSNAGPSNANGAKITDIVPVALSGVTITCTVLGGASCPATSGLTTFNAVAIPVLPSGGSVTFTISGEAPGSGSLSNSANVAPPTGVIDPGPTPNSAGPVETTISPTTLTVNDVTVNEGAGTATFAVRLNAAVVQGFTLKFVTANGSAKAGSDYTATAGTLTFVGTANEVRNVTVPITNDVIVEPSETFVVNFSNISNTAITFDNQAVGTIIDDDKATLSISNVTQAEGNTGTTNFAFTLTLSNISSTAIKVNYATADGTATAGSDYTATSGTLTFTAGQTSKTVAVAVRGDTTVELNETFVVNLSGAVGASIAKSQGVGSIQNDDTPSLRINDVRRAEGNSGTSAFTFTVTLSQASPKTVTVNYATADGTATAGSDYTATSGTLTFSTGQTSKTLAVVVRGDTTPEPNETFVVNLKGAVGARIVKGQGVGFILNDEGSVLRISDVKKVEGNSGTSAFTFTVTLSQASPKTVTVNYATADGTATAGSDYTVTSGTLTFSAGQTNKTVAVTVRGDTTSEPNETFVLNLSGAKGATIFDNQGVGNILNDD